MSQLPGWFGEPIPTSNLARRDFYICTKCGGQSCGGIYSSVCPQCDGICSDPPRDASYSYLCNSCAHKPSVYVCKCDYPRFQKPPTPTPPATPPATPPRPVCCCSCSWCNYICQCVCCCLSCLCMSSSCRQCCTSTWDCPCCSCYW